MPQKVLPDTRFLARGACRGIGHVMFPPSEVTGRRRTEAYAEAVKICNICPVRAECLEWALMNGAPIEGGVVAGLTPSQLAEARKARAVDRRANYIPKCGTERGLAWHLERGETCKVCLDAHSRKEQRYAPVA